MSVALCENNAEENDPVGVVPNKSEIDHCAQLAENIGDLVLKEDYHDVTFVVDGQSFPAHRVILAARCSYFRALLFGGMRESVPSAVINIVDASATAFKILLKYIYTGKMNLNDMKEIHIIEILQLSNKYDFAALESDISIHLQSTLTPQNACVIFDISLLYCLKDLNISTSEFMDRNALEVLACDEFTRMSLDAVYSILLRDSFCVPEKHIFKSVEGWCKANPIPKENEEGHESEKEKRDTLLSAVRLPLIALPDLLNIVRPTGLVPSEVLLDAIKAQSECSDKELDYRGILMPDINIATAQHGAQVVQGEMCASLLDGDTRNYDLDRGYTRHDINDNGDMNCRTERCIKVKLGQPSIINRLRLLLWDKDSRSYSYYIEVSMDDKDWTLVVDYSRYYCRSWQDLHFPDKVVRFIRIVGTRNSLNKLFHLVSFEAMYTTVRARLYDGVVVAMENIATVDKSACIIEGVSRDRNALINGDTTTYDWDSGYTCHQLGNGSIIIQLAQPYVFSSMRLLLWDIDERSYSFYVEVSKDKENWKVVADKRNEECVSWVVLEFDKVAATYIRIIGTGNTANEVFHCVHFECPSSTLSVVIPDDDLDDEFGSTENIINAERDSTPPGRPNSN